MKQLTQNQTNTIKKVVCYVTRGAVENVNIISIAHNTKNAYDVKIGINDCNRLYIHNFASNNIILDSVTTNKQYVIYQIELTTKFLKLNK